MITSVKLSNNVFRLPSYYQVQRLNLRPETRQSSSKISIHFIPPQSTSALISSLIIKNLSQRLEDQIINHMARSFSLLLCDWTENASLFFSSNLDTLLKHSNVLNHRIYCFRMGENETEENHNIFIHQIVSSFLCSCVKLTYWQRASPFKNGNQHFLSHLESTSRNHSKLLAFTSIH